MGVKLYFLKGIHCYHLCCMRPDYLQLVEDVDKSFWYLNKLNTVMCHEKLLLLVPDCHLICVLVVTRIPRQLHLGACRIGWFTQRPERKHRGCSMLEDRQHKLSHAFQSCKNDACQGKAPDLTDRKGSSGGRRSKSYNYSHIYPPYPGISRNTVYLMAFIWLVNLILSQTPLIIRWWNVH